MKYQKKPIVIEAFRIGIEPIPDWFMDNVTNNVAILRDDKPGEISSEKHPTWCTIETLEGTMTADHGDYVIKGIKNEIYPCKPDIFEASYDLVVE